jgi:2-phosphosulfolactate phosphatase
MENVYDQSPFQCRMEWGVRGVEEASARGDIIIIVDVLSFSSAVTTAIHHGAVIYPFPRVGDIETFGKSVDAEVLLGRKEAREAGKPSLSAPSFRSDSIEGKKFVLSSLNGATCAKASQKVPALLVGCLLNVSSVARVANQIQKEMNANITVIACGERWHGSDEEHRELRPAVEDYLGAGAILEKLDGTKSPEAKVCISAFQNSKSNLAELIWNCSSGRELRAINFEDDVSYPSQIDLFQDVPVLVEDSLNQSFFKKYS